MGVLRSNVNVRRLFFAQNISVMGDYFTYVALVGLIKDATDSTFLVSLVYAAYVLPSFFFSPLAGPIVDKFDRRKIIVFISALQAICGIGFLLSSADRIWLALLTQIVISSLAVITLPAFGSGLPNITRNDEELRQANALFGSSWGASVFIGSAVGGLFAATFGRTATFAADIATFVISLVLIAMMKKIPPSHEAEKPSLAGLIDGIRYAFGRKDLLGTYVIDLAAMFFAMPTALIPFWADQLNAPWALGLLYAAMTVGSIIVTLTSGWIKNVHFYGRAIMWAAIGWGAAIALAGISNSLILVLLFLAIAGGADMISALFRGTIWNQTIPDNLRGRLAGIELLSYSIGPLAGQLRAASMAAATSLTFSVTAGGLICVFMVALLASFLPKLRKYDAETNEFAVEMRKIRELEQKNRDEK